MCALAGAGQSPIRPAATDLGAQEKVLRAELLRHPRSPESLARLGVLLQVERRSGEAIKVLERSLALKPDDQVSAQLAEELCRVGREEDAERIIIKLVDGPQTPTIQVLRVIAPCALTLKDPLAAIEVFSQLAELQPDDADRALLRLSSAYLTASRNAYARLSSMPESTEFLSHFQSQREAVPFDTGAELAWIHDRDQSIAADSNPLALAKRAQSPGASAALLYAAFIASEYAAEEEIEVCHRRFPDSPYLVELHATILAQQGDRAGAIELQRGLVNGNSSAVEFRDRLAEMLIANDETQEAVRVYQDQVTAAPDDMLALRGLADALLKLQQFRELQVLLEARWRPDGPLWMSIDLAQALEQTSGVTSAIRVLSSAEPTHRSDKALHYRLMRLYVGAGKTAAANRERGLFSSTGGTDVPTGVTKSP